jgi:lipoprotein NlpI
MRLLLTTLFLFSLAAHARADTVDELLAQAAAALKKGKTDDALILANKAIAADAKNAQAYYLRGAAHDQQRKFKEAVEDFSKTIELNPKAAEAYDRRGSAHFKLGHIKEAIDDFDKFVALRPDEEPGHWRRGIAHYYAGKFAEGKQQFEGYQKVDTNDVENAVWQYICAARVIGAEKARAGMLKIGHDKRVPMMVVYDLFRGKAKPEDVLAAAKADEVTPRERTQRLFYAHLYLGIWFETQGDAKRTLEHLTKAVEDHKIPGHYMWETARVHLELRQKEKK